MSRTQLSESYLKDELKKTKVKYKTISRESGVSMSTISRFMSGQRGINFVTACMLLKWLGHSVSVEGKDGHVQPES